MRGIEHLRESLRCGHGVLLAPNHCRYSDPIALGWIVRQLNVYIYSMASWHLFHQSRFQSFAMRMCGGFSVNREGTDRQSLNTAVDVLSQGKRPLVVFPEGTVFRTNDRLQPLLDGVAFLARTAAKRRAKHDAGKVVIHPVAIKYLFRGNLEKSVEPVLHKLEQRLTLDRSHHQLPLLARVDRILQAQLALQEVKVFGSPRSGSVQQRQQALIEQLMGPLEEQLLGRRQSGSIMPRVKALRSAIVPRLLLPEATAADKSQYWAQLEDIYLAQLIASHPSDYLEQPSDTRILETIESVEEDFYDRSTLQRPLHAILQVGPAIEVDPIRTTREGDDPLMTELSTSLRNMLTQLSSEASP